MNKSEIDNQLINALGNKYASIHEFELAVQKFKREELERKSTWPTMSLDSFDGFLRSKQWVHHQYWHKEKMNGADMIKKTVISEHKGHPMRIIHSEDFAADNLADPIHASIFVAGVILFDDADLEDRVITEDADELLDYLPQAFSG